MDQLTRAPPTVVSAFRVGALLPLLFHLIGRRVVDVGLALSQQLLAELQDDGEMVAGVGELVWTDLKHGHIFQNHLGKIIKRKRALVLTFQNEELLFHHAYFYLLKVLLLFLGVGVIKAHNELTFEGELVVLVEQSSLGMADVQVADRNRAKAHSSEGK